MSMTINGPSVVDSGKFTVRRTISIAAPIEKVWAAITQVEHIAAWLPDTAVLNGSGVGSTGTFHWDGYGEIPIRVEEFDPPHAITYRWNNDDALGSYPTEVDESNSTVFRFTLDADGEGTRLSVVESGFENTSDPAFNLNSHRGGWDFELDELVAYVEGGS